MDRGSHLCVKSVITAKERERERVVLVGLVPPWPSTGMIQELKYIQGGAKALAIRAAARGANL